MDGNHIMRIVKAVKNKGKIESSLMLERATKEAKKAMIVWYLYAYCIVLPYTKQNLVCSQIAITLANICK